MNERLSRLVCRLFGHKIVKRTWLINNTGEPIDSLECKRCGKVFKQRYSSARTHRPKKRRSR